MSLSAASASPPRQVLGACPHDCPDTCSLVTTVQDGVALRVQGNPQHPHTAGVLCNKVSRYVERTYHPERLLQPMRRVGPKGSGRFEPVSWDAALDAIAARLKADIVVVLIGERPGLSSPDSMGAYLTWRPHAQTSDADRNCISNIRPDGVGYADAALKILALLRTMRTRRLSGVMLKDESDRPLLEPK